MYAGAAVVGLLSLSSAKAESISDTMPLSYSAAEIFAKTLRDQTADTDETIWSDFSALGYAKSSRAAPAVQWLPQPMPAVDGFNAKIDGYGGGANHTASQLSITRGNDPNEFAKDLFHQHPASRPGRGSKAGPCMEGPMSMSPFARSEPVCSRIGRRIRTGGRHHLPGREAYTFNRHVQRAWKNLNEVRENPSRW
jgi:hypothetical protein